MRRALDDADDPVAAADVGAFFECRWMFDRQIGIEKCVEVAVARADSRRQASPRQSVGDLARASADERVLLRELPEPLCSSEGHGARARRGTAAWRRWVSEADFH